MATEMNKTCLINNAKFVANVNKLYGDGNIKYQANRYANLFNQHIKKFGCDSKFYSASGRIEIIGNHTDHNNGKVLAGAISVDTLATVSKNNSNIIQILSNGYPIMKIDTNDSEKKESEFGTSIGLIRGVVNYFIKHNFNVGGFNACMVSDVCKGSGVSSSSSFEVLVAEILNSLFNNDKISAMDLAKASQYSENVFFNKPCGLLDQSAIALGGVSFIDFKNLKMPEVKHYNWNFNDLAIVVVNTGGDHSDLTDDYAAIRKEMEQIANFFGKKVLREVNEKDFYENIDKLKNKVNGRAILRAMHFYNENKRVDIAVDAIVNTKQNEFIQSINNSGESSQMLLQNYNTANDKIQAIALGVNYSKTIEGVLASRVHGGGFAGTIISYVNKKSVKTYCSNMAKLFGKNNIYVMNIRENGACEVEI